MHQVFSVLALVLTGNAYGGLAALGRPQVAPGHAETPVVLRPVEVLHLLPRHVNQDLTELYPWMEKEGDRGD